MLVSARAFRERLHKWLDVVEAQISRLRKAADARIAVLTQSFWGAGARLAPLMGPLGRPLEWFARQTPCEPATKRWLAIAFFLVGAVLVDARPLTDLIVGKISKNVIEPADAEMPVTVTSFRSSANMISAVGGQGAGLNCSLPWGVDGVFRGSKTQQHAIPVRQRFRQACVFHDLCYRHGLATYGYSQNDCDELLQEQALRICMSVGGRTQLDACQLDAKKIAFGVKLGGFDSYRGWGQSTYFEFDPNPYRALRFSAARVLDHPFKAKLPEQLKDAPHDLLLSFNVLRGGTRYICANCEDRRLSREELYQAKVYRRVGPLTRRNVQEEGLIWLPAGRLYPAPHLINGSDGRPAVAWAIREGFTNTNSCIVVADSANLLTHTRPKAEGCSNASNGRLSLGTVDTLSSAPQLSAIPVSPPPAGAGAADAVVATGLTFQKTRFLDLCISGDMRKGQGWHEASCHTLFDRSGKTIGSLERLEALQNAPIVRGTKHTYLSRTMPTDGNIDPSNLGRVLAFDVAQRHIANPKPVQGRIDLDVDTRHAIDDTFDPMVPLSSNPEDMRILSVKSSYLWARYFDFALGTLQFFEIDLKSLNPSPKPMEVTTGNSSAAIDLHESWARRPIQVMTSSKSGNTTELVFSRSVAQARSEGPVVDDIVNRIDEVRFEFAVFEHARAQAAATKPEPLKLVKALSCRVFYIVADVNRFRECSRSIADVGSERATPATRLQGAQLLIGRFTSANETTFGLVDACMPSDPLIVRPFASEKRTSSRARLVKKEKEGERLVLLRDADCSEIEDVDALSRPMEGRGWWPLALFKR
jgi:hypothetical protein